MAHKVQVIVEENRAENHSEYELISIVLTKSPLM